eukprot:TRINITY_DN46656_c0_g1_i1.p1 TRINITY_DN46656_c0_g1~~TRINITY_DN46656_c0_g1_i1.p1  ORF type:complete len:371 (-),score=45.98 TRINITY_DN46656_c0_g1_i1:123-1235(-)
MGEPLTVKLLLLGDGTVGKSQLITRYVESRFDPNFIVSIGVRTMQKTMARRGNKVKVQIWDAAGNEKFCTISPAYYASAEAVLLVYDITNHESFEHVEYWRQQVAEHGRPDVPIIILGNKTDLVDEHMVSLRVPREEEERLSHQIGAPIFAGSAKTGEGVDEVFGSLVDAALEKRGVSLMTLSDHGSDRAPRRCCSWLFRKRDSRSEQEVLLSRSKAPPSSPLSEPTTMDSSSREADLDAPADAGSDDVVANKVTASTDDDACALGSPLSEVCPEGHDRAVDTLSTLLPSKPGEASDEDFKKKQVGISDHVIDEALPKLAQQLKELPELPFIIPEDGKGDFRNPTFTNIEDTTPFGSCHRAVNLMCTCGR